MKNTTQSALSVLPNNAHKVIAASKQFQGLGLRDDTVRQKHLHWRLTLQNMHGTSVAPRSQRAEHSVQHWVIPGAVLLQKVEHALPSTNLRLSNENLNKKSASMALLVAANAAIESRVDAKAASVRGRLGGTPLRGRGAAAGVLATALTQAIHRVALARDALVVLRREDQSRTLFT